MTNSQKTISLSHRSRRKEKKKKRTIATNLGHIEIKGIARGVRKDCLGVVHSDCHLGMYFKVYGDRCGGKERGNAQVCFFFGRDSRESEGAEDQNFEYK